MTDIKILSPKTKPVCPNHGCPLEGCGFPLPKKGRGKCPVSGYDFEFECEFDEDEISIAKDKDGNIIKVGKWKITGDD